MGGLEHAPATVTIRPARPDDVPAVVVMVHELAAYEEAPEQCRLTEEQLDAALFGSEPALFCHVAVDPDDTPVGFSLWFLNFSTWEGTHGIYVEDLYVRPTARAAGAGRALLSAMAAICVERGYRRLEWWVLDSEALAGSRAFYRRIGGTELREWVPWRVEGDALARLAGSRRDDRASPSSVVRP
jgi:GNAT superfamily N-acetyltransferase